MHKCDRFSAIYLDQLLTLIVGRSILHVTARVYQRKSITSLHVRVITNAYLGYFVITHHKLHVSNTLFFLRFFAVSERWLTRMPTATIAVNCVHSMFSGRVVCPRSVANHGLNDGLQKQSYWIWTAVRET